MLKPKDIWSLIVDLSECQQKYKKLKEDMEQDPDRETILAEWAKLKFEDRMDFIARMEIVDDEADDDEE